MNKIPTDILELHQALLQVAEAISATEPHDPLAIINPRDQGVMVELKKYFTDPSGKEIAARILRDISSQMKAREAVFICEATAATVAKGEPIPATAKDGNNPHDILLITIEVPGAVYTWAHTFMVLPGGKRELSQDDTGYLDSVDTFNRFLMLPENVSPEVLN